MDIENMKCEICGKQLTKIQISRKNKACCIQCRHLAHAQKMRGKMAGEKHPFWGKKRPLITIQRMSTSNRGKHHSPTTEFKKGQPKLQNGYRFPKGNLNPSWSGGNYGTLRHKLMSLFEYQEWRRQIFKRDDYSCQICGVRGIKTLRANHIKKYIDIIEINNIQSVEQALLCSELWNLINGITICQQCDYSVVMSHEQEWESYFNFNLMTRGFLPDIHRKEDTYV